MLCNYMWHGVWKIKRYLRDSDSNPQIRDPEFLIGSNSYNHYVLRTNNRPEGNTFILSPELLEVDPIRLGAIRAERLTYRIEHPFRNFISDLYSQLLSRDVPIRVLVPHR
jgi:hypothetical protein